VREVRNKVTFQGKLQSAPTITFVIELWDLGLAEGRDESVKSNDWLWKAEPAETARPLISTWI
jgi:hypothetical protein